MTPKRFDRHAKHPVFVAIATGPRREVLRLLLARNSPVTECELVSHLEATEYSPADQRRTVERGTIRTALVHNHLPKLADAGLILRHRADDTVDTTSHPVLEDQRFRSLLEADVDGLDEALSHLADDRRRVLLTVLREAQTSMTRRDMAVELLRADDTDVEPGGDTIEDVATSLHHVHLPALTDDGLVEWDCGAHRAAYTGHPAVEAVFTTVYEPDDGVVDSYDGFLEGLGEAYRELRSEPDTQVGWPRLWEDPSYE